MREELNVQISAYMATACGRLNIFSLRVRSPQCEYSELIGPNLRVIRNAEFG